MTSPGQGKVTENKLQGKWRNYRGEAHVREESAKVKGTRFVNEGI